MPFSSGTGRRNRWGSASPASNEEDDPYNTGKVNRQIENARLRLQDAGVNVDEDTDKRNWFERLTNLPEKQNWFFDALELLGRPGQAVLNTLDKGDEGSPFGAAWRGFSGQERVRGADLVEDELGVKNKIAKAVLGTGLEIVADPTTYVPGAVFAKGARAIGTGAAAAGRGAYGLAEKVPAFGRLSENYIRPGAERTKDALGYIFNRDYKIDETLGGEKSDFLRDLTRTTENTRKYEQEEALKRTLDAAKEAGGLDRGVDVGRVIEAPLRQFEDIEAYELPGGVGTTTSRRELLNMAEGRKGVINELSADLKDSAYTPRSVDQLQIGDKAFLANPDGKRLKGSGAKEIAEIRTVDGQKEFRFKEEPDFVPAAEIKPQGTVRKTELGTVNEQIGNAVEALNKVEKQIRKQYFSRENAALRQLAGRKNKPVNLDELAQSRAFEQVGASPAFNLLMKRREELQTELATLRGQADTLKADTGAQKKGLEGEIDEIKKLADNPVNIQREIPRPERELSTDPGVTAAARSLIRSNDTVRKLALDNGIQVGELEGYMRHVLSKAERELRAKKKPSHVDQGSFNTGNPNKKVLETRKLAGSAEDVNEQIGREFFEPNAFFATAIGQKQLIDYVQAAQFRRKVLSNPSFTRSYVKGMEVGPNQVVIDSNNYKFINDVDDDLAGPANSVSGLADEVGGQYVVTKAVKNALDRYQSLTSDEGIKSFLKAYDKTMNGWKKLALLSPLYHVRNFAGGMFNNYVGGMNTPSLIKYTTSALKEVTDAARGQGSELFNAYRRQGLSSENLSNIEFLRSQDPEEQIRKQVERRSKTGGRKALSKLNLTETSREAGDFIDQAQRFALFNWAYDKGVKQGLSADQAASQAAKKVREVQFDYSNTSAFESNVAARVIPFYRWMRFNMPFQLTQLVSDPRKYANVNKLRQNAQAAVGIDDENVPDYMKESFVVPVYGNEETGTGKNLALNLPLSDLTKLEHPLKTLIDAIGGPVKTIGELGINRNLFTNKPIREFEGQQTNYDLPGNLADFGVDPRIAYLFEQLGGQPARFAANITKAPEDEDQARKFTSAAQSLYNPLKPYDLQRNEYYQLLDELRKLQDYIQYVEQQTGQQVRTVNEIR